MVSTLKKNKDTYEFESHSSPLLRKVLALLAELKETRNGAILYEHILRTLEELDLTHAKIEYAYANFVSLLLEACASQLPEHSSIRTHIKLVQTRLLPPISLIELSTLIQCVEIAADEIANSGEFNAEQMTEALNPLLQRLLNTAPTYGQGVQYESRIKIKKRRTEHKDAKTEQAPMQGSHSSPDSGPMTSASTFKQPLYRDDEVDRGDEFAVSTTSAAIKNKAQETASNELTQLQKDFVQQMRAAISQSDEFGVQLNGEIEALHEAKNIQDVEARRMSLVASLEKLSDDHRHLTEELSKTEDFLCLLESNHQELSDELHRVRMLSLTDELTSLPNRRAFMRRLEDEVSRVQRYGYPLALVLLDIDHFKNINDEHGHTTGDAMLRVYADKVLAMFRHHDMVARYGGEEFAVLLPNTDMRGVLHAFAKIRKRVEDTTCTINGAFIKIPTFSAGLAEYRTGETPSHLIERADSALYRAKRLGRNRIEAQPKEGFEDALEESLENESI